MSQIPTTDSSGVSGTQSAGNMAITMPVTPPMQCTTIPDAIEGLVATHSRNLGGDVSARLIAASLRELSDQLAHTQNALSDRDRQLLEVTEALAKERISTATLSERLNSANREKRVAQACTFVGTALFGIAIDLYKSQINTPSYLLGIFGLVLLIVSWTHHSKEGK